MIKNAICMSVLLCTIASALTNFGVSPVRAIAAPSASKAEYISMNNMVGPFLLQMKQDDKA
ncbi:hypothetical protein [Bacillus sp. FJAT-28004]|uniref:hypothetical protein n=1 Tax=Bacillus sp. FJAT-28004 TaxID=1679165 RepID=UPI0006B539CF|nr:hypothetical protein [Bacillus sp. FJAT-28004]